MTDNTYKIVIRLIWFLVSVIIVYEIAGAKATYYYLLLVMLGMLVVNANKIKLI